MSSNFSDVVNIIKEKSDTGLLLRPETFNIIKILVKRENEVFNHSEEYNLFFDHVIALVAESVAQIPVSVSQTKLLTLLEAANLIIRYIVKRFDSPNVPIILVKALKSLCDVDASMQNGPTYSSIKYMKYPESSKSSNGSGSDKDSPKSETVKRSRSELSIVIMQQLTQPLSSGAVPLTNFSESQFDFTDLFKKEVMDLLRSLNAGDVFLNWCLNCIPIISPAYALKFTGELTLQQKLLHLPQTLSDAQSVRQCLKQIDIDTSNILSVLQLPIMEPLTKARILQLSQISVSALYCCIVTTVAHSISMISNSSAGTQTTAPKSTSTSTQQQQQSASTKEAQASAAAAASATETDPFEEVSRNVVNQSLEIFKNVNEIFKRHAQANVYHNHVCMGAWVLFAGIQGAMSASGSKTQTQLQSGGPASDEFVKSKSPSRHADSNVPPAPQPRVNLFKVQQGFSVLNVLIAKYGIQLMEELLNELRLDADGSAGADMRHSEDILIAQQQHLSPEYINFGITKTYTSVERIICAFNGTTVQQLLTFLATIAYRKACSLKHLTEFGGSEQLSYSDSTTYFNDTLSCSEDDSETEEEEEDGEPDETEEDSSEGYLGSWLKEALSPEAKEPSRDDADKQKQDEGQKAGSQYPAKDEPHEYLELASQIFHFLDARLGDADNKILIKYMRHGLSEQQMILLANILKDLDSDVQMGNGSSPAVVTGSSNNASSNDATNAAIQWRASMMKFSSSIGKYMHNLISNALLNESLQSLLLQNLGVSPWANDSNTWPLEVYSRILAVVVQILLLKPSQEKEAACLSVWHRLVNTLVEGVCGSNVSQFDEYDDLNIEHAQILLFLFHSLNLMQKKSILLLVAGGVIRCAEVCRLVTPEKPLRDAQLVLLSRLLLFLEYLMKHLYSPPEILLEQVSWNLFSIFTLDSEEKSAGLMNYKMKMSMFYRKELEEKYRKLSTVHDGITIKPKLYSLTAIDAAKQNEFKLDGLAWNFILCTPDKVKYPMLIDSLVSILNITDMSTGKVPHHSQFATYYCFSLAWKLLLGLPPSTSHVENLISLEDKQVNLHTLLWSTRCLKPVTSGVHAHNLIVDCLIRQGMYTQAAETMWSNLTEKLNDYNHILTASKMGLDSFLQTFQTQTPRLSKIIMLDSLLSHLFYYQTLAANGEAKNDDQAVSSSSSSSRSSPNIDDNLSKNLLEKLVQTLELMMGVFNRTMTQSLSGQVPQRIMDSIIAISGTRNSISGDLAENLLRSIQTSDKEVLSIEWKRSVNLGDDTNIQQPEQITLNIVEAHLAEIYRHQNFSMVLSLKSAIRSLINWINYMLPHFDDGRIDLKLQDLLVQMLFDVRTDFIYDSISKCLQTLIGSDASSESYQLPVYIHLIQQSYNILIEYCEASALGAVKTINIDESALHDIIRFWESLTEKSNGLKALREFFYERKLGNLVSILLSFSGTNLTQHYSQHVLKFFEKLFQVSENMDSSYSIDEVCASLSDLGTIDSSRLRNWLSHILLGPKGISLEGAISSATSSNFPTPTNLGTQSSAPASLATTDKKSGAEAEAMEVDEECSRVGLPSITNWTTIAQSSSGDQAMGGALESVENNGKLLQTLTKYLVAENRVSTSVSQALFQAMLQLSNSLLTTSNTVSETAVLGDFTSLFQVMVTLADADQGRGHAALFAATIEWLELCKNRILDKYGKPQPPQQSNGNAAKVQLDNITALLKYFSDLLSGVNGGQQRPLSSIWEDDVALDIEEIIANERDGEADEGETTADDSDEDTSNKLCTYTITQKDFMNQHWYWCYTCKMVDDKGCCSICARVCHKNHDVCYAKFGNFYCDCGAKEDGSCRAMSLLDNNNSASTIPSSTTATVDHGEILVSSLKRQTSNALQPCSDILNLICNKPSLAKIIDASREQLSSHDMWRNVLRCLLNFCHSLIPVVRENCAKFSTVGCHVRAKGAIERLHQPEKAFSYSDQVMIATLGSQEGAFENVRMNYSGDQGQTIRQLLSSNLIRRVALCALSSPQGKRQHLAVSHEKGKVTILQLSALLKQADAAKKKLTLTRLSSVPITCNVLSLSANPANEDFLAVCGLRECHVLTLLPNGSVSEHIVLTLQLDNGNYLRRAIWLPGSQTKLALVTAEYVKIYDLAEDSISPLYNFVVPSGDIRDVCFVLQEDAYFLLIMSSLGYIYTQPLSDESLAVHGPFYVTNTLELDHAYIRDVNGQILGGGVSIYYSHTLQMLFFSYAAGRSFMAPLVDVNEGVKCVLNLLHSAKVFSKGGSANGSQSPLCQWLEIQGHPGLICAMQQATNNPVIFMLKPDGYLVQEIKAQNSKAKIMDIVAIRHQVSGAEKTTLILLCEDGSLRIYAANPETTNYWLSPEIQPTGNYHNSGVLVKERGGAKKKTLAKKSSASKQVQKAQASGPNPVFPVDFFEHCSPLHDVEFGGNDLLEIYNVQQLQHRLNSTGLYVASTRFNGFTLEVTNKDANMVMTGVRFLIGTQDSSRSPSAVTILGRRVPTICTRSRWFAIPLTREESLQADKKLSIHFSPSQDPEFVTMLDSIKIYGKSKESFGWPDEIFDESVGLIGQSQAVQQAAVSSTVGEVDGQSCNITPLDKMITGMLDVVDSGFYFLGGATSVDAMLKQTAIDVTTALLLLPTPGVVQQLSRSVLATLHANKSQYHQYKDREILGDVSRELQTMLNASNYKNIDPEGFYRLVLLVRNIAIQRPQQLTKICQEQQYPIVSSLVALTRELHQVSFNGYEESIVHFGLTHKEATIQSLIEILYAFIYTESAMIEPMIKFIVELLLDADPQVSHSAKYAIIRILRPKFKRQRKVLIESTTPPSCQTPTPQSAPAPIVSEEISTLQGNNIQDVDLIEPLGLVAAGGAENRDLVEPSLEALLGMAGNVPAMGGRDIHGEALMEFALELYLQEYEGDIQAFQGLANRLRGNQAFQAVAQVGGAANQPRVNNSAGGSDDEESNAATDGSRDVNQMQQMLAASPSNEQFIDNTADGGNGSDGSGAESIGGRSSNYDEPLVTSTSSPPKMTSKLESVKDEEDVCEQENSAKLHQLRIAVLEKIIDNFNAIDEVNGRQVIPFMQVILMLTTDLDGSQENERNIMTKLLATCVEKLEMNQSAPPAQLSTRSPRSEVQLILLRFVGILMGKLKTLTSKSSSASAATASTATIDNIQFVASSTAKHLMQSGAIAYCLAILESFLPYWRQNSTNDPNAPQQQQQQQQQSAASGAHIVTSSGMPTNTLLKATCYGPVPDMQPFFARQYIKGLADIFELYPQVLTEMAVRLPYQILKLTNANANQHQHSYDSALTFTLCEYMLHMQSPSIRRQVRKLLLYMCGNKERYRKLRDLHSLSEHMKAIRVTLNSAGLTYQVLVSLMDHLKACYEIASARTGNWQRFCLLNTDVLSSLLSLSCQQLDHDQISTIILQLLQAAVVNVNPSGSSSSSSGQVKSKERKDRDKSEELDNLGSETKFDPANCNLLVQQIFNQVSIPSLSLFIKTFLLETNAVNIRWLAHGLIYAFYENCNEANKTKLLEVLFALWPLIPVYGKRTPQFIDLIGFFTLNTKSAVHLLPEKVSKAVKLLREQNEFVAKHPSASLYTALGQVLDLDGFYLESEPCLVCNSVDQSFNIIKLTSIKMDSKFTTNSNIIKLVNAHVVSKIILRIGDLKRTKMVRTINVYYNSRNVQAVVELKNRPSMWHRAKSVTLQSGQTDVKIELSLPIVASNLMFEYEDFYETVTSLPESLQCPRCSATVPANPGVCNNCGEHVFQCHKCRAIHYDEKDPFICQSCGFCKYAKFDYSIYGRPTSAVDAVESDEDRAKTVQTINNLLEKADKSYRELMNVRQSLELLIPKIADGSGGADTSAAISSTMHINRVVQQMEKKYCNEGRTHFEDLTKIVQKIQACRRELVAYDRLQIEAAPPPLTPVAVAAASDASEIAQSRCYGCALASIEQILTLLRGMASQMQSRVMLCGEGLIEELATNNVRHQGADARAQEEVRTLLCLLTRDLPEPTERLCALLKARVISALEGSVSFANLDSAVRNEMALLEAMALQEDSCWQMKLKPIIELFKRASNDPRGPATPIVQPCLRVIQHICNPPPATSKRNKGKSTLELCSVRPGEGISVNTGRWLEGDKQHTFEAWKKRQSANAQPQQQPQPQAKNESFIAVLDEKRQQTRRLYLMEKYGHRWHLRTIKKHLHLPLKLIPSYLPSILFHPTSRLVRVNACSLVTSWMSTHERKLHLLNLLTCFLKYVGEAGEASAEFIELFKQIAQEPPYRQYLALNNVITKIAELLNQEFEKIYKLEESTTLSTDLGQGYALKQYVDLISMFLDNAPIRKSYKGLVLQSIIQSYLNLRKLVVQRTMYIDEAQKSLMSLLEELTSGTEEETASFIAICIDIVRKTAPNDMKTPLFMFERLCSTIHSEDSDSDEFFLNLEKDQLQEEFIQGRMLGNPYPSSEPGLGPLMRDVKNKICFDCEIMAMLEDDNGMELLVHNKIISLDLPVKEVYKRVWLAGGGERDTMRIVYRIRGLSGDATEEFIENLKPVTAAEEDNEQTYRMVNVIADCNGLKVILDRMSYLQSVSRAKPFLQTLLKLFLMCVKVKKCREELCQPELGAISNLLKVLHLCLQHQVQENDPQMSTITEQLLEIMETILAKAASDSLDSFLQFSLTFGGPEYIEALLSCTNHANVRNNPHVLRCLIRVVAALVYGNDIKMALLCDHFKNSFDFEKFDHERSAEEEFQLELFCILCSAIERNTIGGILKDYIMGLGIVDKAVNYIVKHAPTNRLILLPFASSLDSDELKLFISKPSLKYILQFLSGLASKHEKTQLAVAKDLIPVIHQLEQVSSDEHVGSLAENLLEALSSEPATAKIVQEYRDSTRAEKKRLAMATREKQLNAMGMRTNEKGQVTAKEQVLQELDSAMADLVKQETGLTCFICREGYASQPNQVMGIYTFTKRCPLEDFEQKSRKTMGYTTVSHFNVVHTNCHMSAIRMSRGRDEWESASLQNTNTKCNGLLPLWGPEVSETAFSACMARQHGYLQDSTQRIEITFASGIHDLKLLLLRFAHEKTFHDDCSGGGPQSNMHLVPYLMFFSLYISLSTRSYTREEKALTTFLNQPASEKWLESAYEVDGPAYQAVLSIVLHTPEMWAKNRIKYLKRLLVAYHARHLYPSSTCKALNGVGDKDPKDYNAYKGGLMLFALVELIYKCFFAKVVNPKDEDWSVSLFNYIRKNDEAMLKSAVTVLENFRDEYLPCTSFGEFCDVAGLLDEIDDPDQMLADALQSMPSGN